MFQNGLIGLQLGGGNLPMQGGGKRKPQGGMPLGGMWGGGGKPAGMQPRPFEGGMNPWQMPMQSVNQGGLQNGLLSMFGGSPQGWGQMRRY